MIAIRGADHGTLKGVDEQEHVVSYVGSSERDMAKFRARKVMQPVL